MIVEITRGMEYRIYPTKEQKVLINKTLGCKRFIYNHFLQIRRNEWKFNHKSINYSATNAMLTDLKRYDEYSWLNEVDSTALQNSLRDLQVAYDRFFKKISKYPKFKSKHAHCQKYRSQCVNNNIKLVGNTIQLPKIGKVKIKLSRELVGKIVSVTVTHTASNKYYVSICVKYETELLSNSGHEIGIDVGVKDFYADTNGNVIKNPKILTKFAKRLARSQRKLAHKKRGSAQYEKQRIKVARIYEKIKNVRDDFQHKLTYHLAEDNAFIAIEELNIKGMLKNHKLAKAISDVAWSKFFIKLEYKVKEHGGVVVKIPTFYPSSQTCHECGYKNPLIKNLLVRDWVCPICGAHHDRDRNAAINILAKAKDIA